MQVTAAGQGSMKPAQTGDRARAGAGEQLVSCWEGPYLPEDEDQALGRVLKQAQDGTGSIKPEGNCSSRCSSASPGATTYTSGLADILNRAKISSMPAFTFRFFTPSW